MKIRVLNTPSIEARHGATKGREFDVIREKHGRGGGVWVRGDAGEEVLLLRSQHEYEVVQ